MKRKTFQEILNDKMDRLCLSDEFVARMTGVSRPTVQRWKEGVTQPREKVQLCILDQIQDMV